MPLATGNLKDGLVALKNGQFITLRVPYPLGFFAKGSEGRIDDANGGWKGKGLWTTCATERPSRRRQGNQPKVVKFQLRPDPLAR